VDAVRVEVVVARLYQLDDVVHGNVVVANDAELAAVLLALERHLRFCGLLKDSALAVDLAVLCFVEFRSLYSARLLHVLVVQVGTVAALVVLEVLRNFGDCAFDLVALSEALLAYDRPDNCNVLALVHVHREPVAVSAVFVLNRDASVYIFVLGEPAVHYVLALVKHVFLEL